VVLVGWVVAACGGGGRDGLAMNARFVALLGRVVLEIRQGFDLLEDHQMVVKTLVGLMVVEMDHSSRLVLAVVLDRLGDLGLGHNLS